MQLRSHETETLVEHFKTIEDGTFCAWSKLSAMIGLDTSDYRGVGRRRVMSAMRIVAGEGINVETRQGGVYRLIPEEYYQTTSRTLRRTRNAARDALKRTVRGLSLEVPEESRLRLSAERVVLALHLHASESGQVEKVRRGIENLPPTKPLKLTFDMADILK